MSPSAEKTELDTMCCWVGEVRTAVRLSGVEGTSEKGNDDDARVDGGGIGAEVKDCCCCCCCCKLMMLLRLPVADLLSDDSEGGNGGLDDCPFVTPNDIPDDDSDDDTDDDDDEDDVDLILFAPP